MATIYKGQVFKGYIAPQHNVHGPVRFEYKGLWPIYRAAYFRELRMTGTDEDAGESVVANMMAMMITSWNLEYPKKHPDTAKAGQPVPRTAEAIKGDLMVHLRNRIVNIMTFASDSDIDPEDPIEEQVEKIKARDTQKTLAELAAEADAELVGN